MPEEQIKWTDQQKQAIQASGSDILVTASAGTGKTAVLSGRCVHIVSGLSNVKDILVLTFTEAAAEQMRSRIAEMLKKAYNQKPCSRLRYQLILLQGAEISTIHSFCKRLITEYFYKLELDPNFSIIDGDEQKLLKSEILEEVIESAWQQPNLRADLEKLLYKRHLDIKGGFLSKIIELSDFLDGIISRDNWYERAQLFANTAQLINSDLGDSQKKIVLNRLLEIQSQILYAIQLYETENPGGGWSKKWKKILAEPVWQYINLIESDNWQKFSEQIHNYQGPSKYEYKPRDLSGFTAEIIRDTSKAAKGSFESLLDFAILNPAYLESIGGSVQLQTRILIELIRHFDLYYKRAKSRINSLDFADLEHYALKLLSEEDSTDKPVPSETALSLRKKYKHIFIDEYQDINSVQQRILEMLSPGDNILQVGDVKQSIYAFRGAEPTIFREQLKLATSHPDTINNSIRVDLNANFRSDKRILDFVNKIFSRIMTASFSGIDYDESARLKPALADTSQEQTNKNEPIVEFHILDETAREDNEQENDSEDSIDKELEIVTSRQRQAALIARRIKQIVGAETGKAEFQIFDKDFGELRDIKYSDIAILMRSLAKKANDYLEVLRMAGVPVSSQATAGYFQTTEISDCLSLLKILDNPRRDIELAAVLRSPFFKISDTELAKIKLHGKGKQKTGDFYDCIVLYCNKRPEVKLSDKLHKVLDQIDCWRTAAQKVSLADLIWQIFRQTGYLSFVSAMPNGCSRRANLLKLHQRAIQFEDFAGSKGITSLTRFVEFIEKLQDIGQDWAPAEPQDSAGNAVRILSVHKSKGLEFPVVFLAELESSFNKRDVQSECLINADDTLGLQIIDNTSNSKVSSLAHQVIAEKKTSMLLAEEMRILYVATTRAKEKIILTASQRQSFCKSIIANGLYFSRKPIPDWLLKHSRNPLQWILYGLSDQRVLHKAFETGLEDRAVDDKLFSFKLYDYRELIKLSESVIRQKQNRLATTKLKSVSVQKDTKLFERIKASINHHYQFRGAPLLPAKTSVTQITHRNDEYVKLDYSKTLDRRPLILTTERQDNIKKPESRFVGTATHLILSQIGLDEPVTTGKLDDTIDKLIADKSLSPELVEYIDKPAIMKLFRSDLGKLLFDKTNSIFREWPFTFALEATDYVDLNHFQQDTKDLLETQIDDFIIVQGIIDCLIERPDGLVVIDFKTDNINAAQASESAGLYQGQLALYARAASTILKKQSCTKWLYFLTPGVSVQV